MKLNKYIKFSFIFFFCLANFSRAPMFFERLIENATVIIETKNYEHNVIFSHLLNEMYEHIEFYYQQRIYLTMKINTHPFEAFIFFDYEQNRILIFDKSKARNYMKTCQNLNDVTISEKILYFGDVRLSSNFIAVTTAISSPPTINTFSFPRIA